MTRHGVRAVLASVSLGALVIFFVFGPQATTPRLEGQAAAPAGQPSTAKGDWPHYNADLAGTRFSPLTQITGANFNQLKVAWRFKTDMFGPFPEFKLEGTPLAINGILYATAGTRRSVVAIDGQTGELLWAHSMMEGHRAAVAPRQLSGRGLEYWTDGRGDERILYITTGYRLVELNAKNGAPITTFGTDGVVDLKVGVIKGAGEPIDLETGEIGVHSTPVVVGDVAIIGSSFREGATVPTHDNTKGLVRAFDVRTGHLIWTFNTIPRPGEFGNDTWENDSWATNGNTGVWTQISVDPDLGLAYLPVETPSSDYYGGSRPGNNLFAESLVAVDVKTGVRKWHFQFVHHPIWNFDNSSAPILMDATVNGRTIKAVAQPSKLGFLYVFDRATGEPVWPIEEQPVEQSTVPGEKTSPTQPFPTKPPAYARNYLRVPDDVIDFTPQLRAEALDLLKRFHVGTSPFTPPVVGDPDGIVGAIGAGTATNWPGSGGDPERHVVYAQGSHIPSSRSLVAPPPGFSDLRYVSGISGRPFVMVFGPGDCCSADSGFRTRADMPQPKFAQTQTGPPKAIPGLSVEGLPIIKPPYGTISAISLDRGEILWQVPAGDTPDNIRENPALRGVTIPKTGQAGVSGVGLMSTRTIVVMGDPQETAPPGRPAGAMLRAYDKDSGAQVGEVLMAAPQSGSPMTYMAGGKQYIVVAISGGRYSGEYAAYALP